MENYFVYKLKDGSIVAYSAAQKDLGWTACAVVEARNCVEAGAKFAIEWLLDRDALQALLREYLDLSDWKVNDSGSVSANQLKNLDSLLESSVFEGLTEVKGKAETKWINEN